MKSFNLQSKYRHLFSAAAISCFIVLTGTSISASAQKYKPAEKKIKLPPANQSLQDAQPAPTTSTAQPMIITSETVMQIEDMRRYPNEISADSSHRRARRHYVYTKYKCPKYNFEFSEKDGWNLRLPVRRRVRADLLKIMPPSTGQRGEMQCIYTEYSKETIARRQFPQTDTCIAEASLKTFVCRKKGAFVYAIGSKSIAPSNTADLTQPTNVAPSDRTARSREKIPTIWWQSVSASQQTLKPRDGALLVRVYETPTPSLCKQKLADGGYPLGYSIAVLRPGMQFCYRSRKNGFRRNSDLYDLYGTFKITGLTGGQAKTLNIDYTTWLRGEYRYH